ANAGRQPLSLADRLCGLIVYETDQLDTARQHFARAIDDVAHAWWTVLREWAFGLALVHQAQGRPAAAEAAVRWDAPLGQGPGRAELPPGVEPSEARLALMRGDLAAATHWLNTSVLDPTGTAMALLETRLTRVRVALALATEESLAQAEGILPPLLDEVRGRHLTARLIELLALQALLLQAR